MPLRRWRGVNPQFIQMKKTIIKAGEKINLSKLPAGEYRLQHGNKLIPINKKGDTK